MRSRSDSEDWPSPAATTESAVPFSTERTRFVMNVALIGIFVAALGFGTCKIGPAVFRLLFPCLGGTEHREFARQLVLSALEDGDLYRATISLRERRELDSKIESLPTAFDVHLVDDSWGGALYFCIDFENGRQGQVTTYGACDPPKTARVEFHADGTRYWHD